MGGICPFPRPQSNWVVTASEGSGYQGEKGGQASIYSSETHGPVCWVSGHPSLRIGWLILPAALLTAQMK